MMLERYHSPPEYIELSSLATNTATPSAGPMFGKKLMSSSMQLPAKNPWMIWVIREVRVIYPIEYLDVVYIIPRCPQII